MTNRVNNISIPQFLNGKKECIHYFECFENQNVLHTSKNKRISSLLFWCQKPIHSTKKEEQITK